MDDLPIFADTVAVINFLAQLEGGIDAALTVDWVMNNYWHYPPTKEATL